MTYENLKETVFDGRPVVLKFGADFCQPCKVLQKTLEKLEPQYPNVNFIHVDVEESPELAQEFQIQNIPVMIFMNENGEIVNRKVGLMSEKVIVSEIENLLNA
jgi:thioredoxin 1